MIYKEFGKTGIKMSALGFGAMRLPMIEGGEQKAVNEELAIPMIHKAFELGVNYIDTAPYYLDSLSEITVGKALKGWRDKVYVSTKNPIEDATYDGWMKRLEKSLKQLDVDAIDFYHMWGISLSAFRDNINIKGGPIEAALKAKEQGLIKHISFSYHDKAENMKEIVDSGYFESVLMQYNLLDRVNEQNIAYCHEKGLGVVIMGPVAGGRLGAPSPAILELLKESEKTAVASADMALRYVLSNPCVNIALSGMSTMEQVLQNCEVASVDAPLSSAELARIDDIVGEIKKFADLYCTGCNYCMPCPQGINIPRVFGAMNNHRVYNATGQAKWEYSQIMSPESKDKPASSCVECGACEEKCPQKIKIVKQLKECHELLSA